MEHSHRQQRTDSTPRYASRWGGASSATRGIVFADRTEAGAQLAARLVRYKDEHPLILALPRGGVPVGCQVALRLDAPLDTLVVRKIGMPLDPEFGVGAVAPGDVLVLDRAIIKALGLRSRDLDPILAREVQEMGRRMIRYKSGLYQEGADADMIIIVDDGLATGLTARAAIESAKMLFRPAKIVFAAPVCSQDRAAMLRPLIDEVVCVSEIDGLLSIGDWYHSFRQVPDEEVIACLERANSTYTRR